MLRGFSQPIFEEESREKYKFPQLGVNLSFFSKLKMDKFGHFQLKYELT